MLQYKKYLEAGLKLHQEGRFQKALEVYEKAQSLEKSNPQLMYLMGTAYAQLGMKENAIIFLNRSLTINPNNYAAYSNLGVVQCELKRFNDALESYDKAIDLKHDYAEVYFNRANVLSVLKRFNESLEGYDKAISLKQDYVEAYSNRGIVLKELKRFKDSLDCYDKVIALRPGCAEAYSNRGIILKELKRYDEALESYDKAIALKSDVVEAYNNRGVILKELKRYNEALESYDKAIALKSDFVEAYNNRGIVFNELKRFEESLECYDKAIAHNPNYEEAYNNRGIVLNKLKRFNESLQSYDRAIALRQDYADAYSNRGMVLNELGRFNEALDNYDKAITFKQDHEQAFNNRGIVLDKLNRINDSLESYERAIALKSDFAEAYNNRGIILNKLKRFDESLESYDKAITLKQDYDEVYSNRGVVLNELKRFNDSLDSCDNAIALRPDFAEAYNNRGGVLKALNRFSEALDSYDKAIALKPDFSEAYNNRGIVLKALNRFYESLESYEKAITLNPDIDFLNGEIFHLRMHNCDWSRFDHYMSEMERNISEKARYVFPLISAGLVNSLISQRIVSEVYTKSKFDLINTKPLFHPASVSNKIRVGYYSSDFHDHATMHLMADLFLKHDANQFELYAFSYGPKTSDPWQNKVRQSVRHYIDCREMSDALIAKYSRDSGIDIAIDLKGSTTDSRQGIFSNKAAPIQVNYLGFPGTMGAEYIDYIIADRILIPEESRQFYSEKIAYLPNCYQPNCKYREKSNKEVKRSDFGLPDDCLVFCSFNNQWKITPDIFSAWMRILREVDNSVIWIMAKNETAQNNLKSEAEKRGVDSSRLVFTVPLTVEEHLNRHLLADLMLDTFPYGAHTTCSDTLRMGLPIVTMIGETFASRVAGSLLTTIRLPELITRTLQEYEDLAIRLSKNPSELAAIKSKLIDNQKISPLFDSDRYARDIEYLYIKMVERYRQGLPPDHILYSENR